MKVDIDYKESIFEIDQLINNLPKELDAEEKVVLKKIGTIVKKWVIYFLHRSDIEQRAKEKAASNYDGSRPYIHAKDEVLSSVRKSKNGDLYVSIRGGKKTGYKWNLISNGHVARDGRTWVPGNHFIEKALAKAQTEIDNAINEMLRKVVN
ncbi:hypothetical protein [Clostridium sp. HBUAS56010]|uniref:hypothetical protein n=1 Tax=Clostridium sp. HBUAS56010 TaxID=2571127 RepID=UPI001177EC37|nr:hypothetical protein [Clostridium sp. HBUAS56010]